MRLIAWVSRAYIVGGCVKGWQAWYRPHTDQALLLFPRRGPCTNQYCRVCGHGFEGAK